jgi:hypothetical protein
MESQLFKLTKYIRLPKHILHTMMVLVQLKQNHVLAVVYVMIQVVNANVSKDTPVLTAAFKMHWLYKKTIDFIIKSLYSEL